MIHIDLVYLSSCHSTLLNRNAPLIVFFSKNKSFIDYSLLKSDRFLVIRCDIKLESGQKYIESLDIHNTNFKDPI
jgi:hypothetical protein